MNFIINYFDNKLVCIATYRTSLLDFPPIPSIQYMPDVDRVKLIDLCNQNIEKA